MTLVNVAVAIPLVSDTDRVVDAAIVTPAASVMLPPLELSEISGDVKLLPAFKLTPVLPLTPIPKDVLYAFASVTLPPVELSESQLVVMLLSPASVILLVEVTLTPLVGFPFAVIGAPIVTVPAGPLAVNHMLLPDDAVSAPLILILPLLAVSCIFMPVNAFVTLIALLPAMAEPVRFTVHIPKLFAVVVMTPALVTVRLCALANVPNANALVPLL